MIPATCRRGIHSLWTVGYDWMRDINILKLSCRGCSEGHRPAWDSAWSLLLTRPDPERVEMDDGPYINVISALRRAARARHLAGRCPQGACARPSTARYIEQAAVHRFGLPRLSRSLGDAVATSTMFGEKPCGAGGPSTQQL